MQGVEGCWLQCLEYLNDARFFTLETTRPQRDVCLHNPRASEVHRTVIDIGFDTFRIRKVEFETRVKAGGLQTTIAATFA
jgi:hypothetical protein